MKMIILILSKTNFEDIITIACESSITLRAIAFQAIWIINAFNINSNNGIPSANLKILNTKM